MQLPNSNKNVIDRRKLVNYCSNLNHADGCHKARVSESALGLNLSNVEILEAAFFLSTKKYNAVEINKIDSDRS